MVLLAGWWHANRRWVDPRIYYRASTWAVWLLAIGLFVFPAQSTPVQLLSARSSVLPLPAGGDGDSVDPDITPDGRYVVFESTANDLRPGGNNYYSLNVFLRDRASNTTVLVSENMDGTGGGNRGSMLGQASTNGQFVVFQSDASDLVPDDTNNATDIFVRDLATGTMTLVSVSTNGSPANGDSTDPVMTPDGRYVAFISSASNLVPNDNNGIPDVFVRDLQLGTNYLVSVNAIASGGTINPVMATPVITPDGRHVAFFSSAGNLAPGVPADSAGEIYVRNLVTGTTTWASTNAAAMVSAALGLTGIVSYDPEVSDNGQYVVFKAGQTSPDGATMILRYDLLTGTTTAISTNDLGSYIGYDNNSGPVMTPDGRFVAYVQHVGATNSGLSSVHVWDGQTATDTLVSDDGSGVPPGTASEMPLISSNGQFVAFISDATNLVTNVVTTPTNNFHIYLRNLPSGTTQLVDVDTNGFGSIDETVTSLSLSADGRLIAFSSPDGGLVAGDNNQVNDVFVRDTDAATTEMVSERDASVALEAPDAFSSLSPESVSADGQWVAFSSPADDLVPNDTNQLQDVFVRDLLNGTNLLVSAAYDGGPALGGYSGSAVISTNGRYVAFVSSATNLVPGVAGTTNNVYLRDLQTGTTLLVSVATNGTCGNGDSSDPVLSPDGRYVAFLSQANNLASGITSGVNTYWRDVSLGQTVGLPGPGAFRPSLGDDGRYVAYSATNGLGIRDMQLETNIYTKAGTILTAVIDPTGTEIFYETTNTPGTYRLCVDDVGSGTNFVSTTIFSMTTKAPLAKGASWSDDGRWLAFLSTSSPNGGDDGVDKVYLRDFQTGTLSLIGLAGPATNTPELLSDTPVISGNGRFVAYRCTVTNTVIGDTTAPPNVFLFDRLTGSTTLLTTGTTLPGPVTWMSRPDISAGGATVAFLNVGSSLTSGVLNRTLDAFGASVDVNAALVDSDGDGIPDWWMVKYFGHPTGEAADHSLASDDADGDGMSNLQEYLAGTDPTDPNSVFRLWASPPTDGMLGLTWPAMLGRSYQIQYKTNLTDSVWLTAPDDIWVIGSQGYFTAPANQPRGFYRLFESN